MKDTIKITVHVTIPVVTILHYHINEESIIIQEYI